MAKKRGKKKRRPESESSTIRPDLQQIIKTVFPDDLVEFPPDWEGDELDEVHETVRHKLAALKGVRLVESAAPSDDSRWDTYDDDDDEFQLTGRVDAVNVSARQFTVLGLTLTVTSETEWEDGLDDIDDLEPGMRVEVDYEPCSAGFCALEVEREDD